ncbi:MAG: tryptophan halogenase family protein [Wenzhouxiangellaceae bacterium]|nr:tryptophan halogenase family protein [Wenzhouxiangellaceae bacterium]
MNSRNDSAIRKIVVVGGGSAGWITAGLIAARHASGTNPRFSVTLVESPQVGTIGVGEGTWPTLRTTLQQLGISEASFLAECEATFKQGTRFSGWVDGREQDSYYHPFTAPSGYPATDLASHWQADPRKLSFADAVSPQGMICDLQLGPKQAQTPEYAGVLNYAYHLDAGKFAGLLTEHCTTSLGVRHISDHITAINAAENGDIASLETASHGAIGGDLFIDCSGMRSILLGDHFGVPLIEQSDTLFNDTALAVQVPYAEADAPIASQTISTARSFGWIWDIGLTTRRGIGYVYSSRHGSDDEAMKILEQYLDATHAPVDTARSPRRISFAPGYRAQFWHRNCVAVGMASGFIEPLEASALVMVELSARMIVDELPANRHVMDIVARRFNEKFRYRWERIIDFLKLHYVLSRRDDAPYWRDNRSRASIPDNLADLIELWRFRPPSPADFPHIDEIFSAASYQYVLYGMGFEPAQYPARRDDRQREQARRLLDNNIRTANQYIARLPANRALLSNIAQHGLPAAG